MMFVDYLLSKKQLVKELGRLREENDRLTEEPDRFSVNYYKALEKHYVLTVDKLKEEHNQQLQNKDQRIAELQQMLIQLQNNKLEDIK